MRILFFKLGMLVTLIVNAQKAEKNYFISNETIAYKIGRTSLDLIDSNIFVPSKYVIVCNLPDSVRILVKNISAEDWFILLEDAKSDWAANLILHDIYQKDAIDFKIISTKERWSRVLKKAHTRYWKELFKIKSHKLSATDDSAEDNI